MTGLFADGRLAVRWLARRPGLAAASILSLALGIGVTTALISLVDAILYRPFPVHRPEELVAVVFEKEGERREVSAPDYRDLRLTQEVLTGLAAHAPFTFSVRAGESTARIAGELVSSNYLDVLGVAPRPGRGFLSGEDERPTPVAVISHRLWRRSFLEDPDAVGSTLRVNGHDLTIVGIAPEGFRGVTVVPEVDLWVPLSMLEPLWPGVVEFFERRDQPGLNVLGRLAPESGVEAADAAMRVHSRALELAYPDTNTGWAARVIPLTDTRVTDRESVVSYLGLAFGVVSAVFLIACINVAGLRLADLQLREGEIAIRRALGASALRIGRQLFLENLAIYAAAFVSSLAVAALSLVLLQRLTLFRMALSDVDLRLDFRIVAVAFGITLLGAILGSIAPRRFSLPDRSGNLHSRSPRLRCAFVVAQVALTSALLVGTGLLARTLANVYSIDPGFRTDPVLFVSVDLQSMEFRYDESRARGFYRDVLEGVSALPGVRSAAWSADTPFERFTVMTLFVPEETVSAGEPDWIATDADIVTPGFLRTMGIELVSGRDFLETDDEDAPGVVLVNETMARTVWPSETALGKRVRVFSRRGIRHDVYEVVGIVRDVKVRTLWEEPRPYLYFPLAQRFFQRMNLHVYTSLAPMSVLPGVREVVRSVDDDLPIFDARPLSEERAILMARQRAVGTLLALSALLALVLAAVGIYGVTSHHVARRRPEVGLRMALGADRRDIARWVLRHGLAPALFGVALGLVLAGQTGTALESLLVGVEARDPLTFAGSALVLVAVAAAASAIPAERATRIDPAVALRGD